MAKQNLDRLTPLERMRAFREGKSYDRIPCVPSIGDHAATVLGIKVSDYNLNPQLMAAAQIAAYRLYGHDSVGVGPGSTGIAEAVGSVVRFPEQSTPLIEKPLLTVKANLDDVDLPDPRRSGRFPVFLEALEVLVEKLGAEVPISLTLGGPVSTAAGLRGTEWLLRDFRVDPEFAHTLLDFAVRATVPFVREVARLGVGFNIVDPVSSGSLLSPQQYIEFAAPHQTRLISEIKAAGASAMLHICGDTRRSWGQMANTGASALSLDNVIDLAAAKQAIGHQITLAGNIDPTATMYLGTPQDVERDAKRCLRDGHDAPAGYILAIGCGLPIFTPHENVHALMNVSRDLGRYPINPARLS